VKPIERKKSNLQSKAGGHIIIQPNCTMLWESCSKAVI